VRWKQAVKSLVPQSVFTLRVIWKAAQPLHPRRCPLCGYHGYFRPYGRPLRVDAKCQKCGSLERHRHFWNWFNGDKAKLQEPILHFAPEPILSSRLRQIYQNYQTADLFQPADLKLDIEKIDLPSGAFNTIICSHVLEHVNDRKALAELCRVLSPEGRLICAVPIVEGWDQTYENEAVKTPHDRFLHFGQGDHVRYYGRDFRDRLRAAGFANVVEITASGQDVIDYSLMRGDKFFICAKS